jgi:hypothetical protein
MKNKAGAHLLEDLVVIGGKRVGKMADKIMQRGAAVARHLLHVRSVSKELTCVLQFRKSRGGVDGVYRFLERRKSMIFTWPAAQAQWRGVQPCAMIGWHHKG